MIILAKFALILVFIYVIISYSIELVIDNRVILFVKNTTILLGGFYLIFSLMQSWNVWDEKRTYTNAVQNNDVGAWQRYVDSHPNGDNVSIARTNLKRLQEIEKRAQNLKREKERRRQERDSLFEKADGILRRSAKHSKYHPAAGNLYSQTPNGKRWSKGDVWFYENGLVYSGTKSGGVKYSGALLFEHLIGNFYFEVNFTIFDHGSLNIRTKNGKTVSVVMMNSGIFAFFEALALKAIKKEGNLWEKEFNFHLDAWREKRCKLIEKLAKGKAIYSPNYDGCLSRINRNVKENKKLGSKYTPIVKPKQAVQQLAKRSRKEKKFDQLSEIKRLKQEYESITSELRTVNQWLDQNKLIYRTSFYTEFWGQTAGGHIEIYKNLVAFDISRGNSLKNLSITFDEIRKIECKGEVVKFYTDERNKVFYIAEIRGGAPQLFANFTRAVQDWRSKNCKAASCGFLVIDDHTPRKRRERSGNSMEPPNISGWKDLPAFGGGKCR